MSILPKIPSMAIEDINKLRKNAVLKLDDPKSHQLACDVLDAIDKALERRYIPGMIQTFLDVYPEGFYGQKQAIEERQSQPEYGWDCLSDLKRLTLPAA